MEKVVERLKREASEDFDAGREMGAEWGAAWAKDHAGRDDLRAVAEGRLTFEDERVIDFLVRKYDYKPDDYGREFGHEHYQVAPPMDFETFEKGFAAGFNEGAHQIWSGIRHEFE